jgi:hypothetical protein
VDPKGSPAASRKPEDDDWDDCPAGAWQFYTSGDNTRAGMLFKCPCGCGSVFSFNFMPERGTCWQWNGDEENPTCTPSMLIYQMDQRQGKVVGEHWHGWLTAGRWVSC